MRAGVLAGTPVMVSWLTAHCGAGPADLRGFRAEILVSQIGTGTRGEIYLWSQQLGLSLKLVSTKAQPLLKAEEGHGRARPESTAAF